MCARFIVLSDTPIAAAIAGCAIPLSRNNTIWMRWRCAVVSRRISALLHLTICFPESDGAANHTSGNKTNQQFPPLTSKIPDSSRYGSGIKFDNAGTVEVGYGIAAIGAATPDGSANGSGAITHEHGGVMQMDKH